MFDFADLFSSGRDLLVVILGFSAIIIIHEAGHFFAARWAGIRVLAFAVGFGPALVSYRRGFGFRRGSSEADYLKMRAEDERSQLDAVDPTAFVRRTAGVSSTEYRLNALPFGGYVKMLGQDDADPGATSSEPDSYPTCVPWKRMVVISAGVVFNVITAALIFMIVLNPHVGLRTEPAKIGAVVEANRPAATTVALNAAQLGVTEPGLKPGDTILSIDGERPATFQDVTTAIIMGRVDVPLEMEVQRPGVAGTLRFNIIPKIDPGTGTLSIGAAPMASGELRTGRARVRAEVDKALAALGFPELHAGMRLVEVDGRPAGAPYDIDAAVEKSGGKPVKVTFESPTGRVSTQITPQPRLMSTAVVFDAKAKATVALNHVIGLTPVIAIEKVIEKSIAQKAGLLDGDIFARIGDTEWPSHSAGMTTLRDHKDSPMDLVVLRKDAAGHWMEKSIPQVRTDKDGKLGFVPTDSAQLSNVVSRGPWPMDGQTDPTPSGGSLPGISAGSRIVAVNGTEVSTLGEVRNVLKTVLAADPSGKVTLSVKLPSGSGDGPVVQVPWTISRDESVALAHLGWENPLNSFGFEHEQFLWRSETTLGAVGLGLHETQRMMMNTYATFAGLFRGTLKIEHLKGPVGIAHIGVSIADRGWIWLLFLMGVVSINLAVINFLPMPIADGGHMVFLLYEQFTGRQPSVRFQNVTAIAGLAVIGTLFLVVTFHDITNVFTGLK